MYIFKYIYIYIYIYVYMYIYILIKIYKYKYIYIYTYIYTYTYIFVYIYTYLHGNTSTVLLRVDLNPSKKKSTLYYVRNVRTGIFNPFFELVQKTWQVRFLYLRWHDNLCKGTRTLRNFPQKCRKIAGCWECAVYGSRPLIASKPGSSFTEWPGLDNITTQPWSDATCPCTTTSSTWSCLSDKTWKSMTKRK